MHSKDVSQAIKGSVGSQRTRRQKVDAKQFKAEINFINKNKQKAEIDIQEIQQELCIYSYRKHLWFSEILNIYSSYPAVKLIWSGWFYNRNICTLQLSRSKLKGPVSFTCQTLPCFAAQTSASHFLVLRDSESIRAGYSHL